MKTLNRKRLIRHGRHLGGTAIGKMGFCSPWAVDVHGKGPEWIEVVELDMPLGNLPEQFHGKKIVHISDLHYSRTVSGRYLRNCIKRINQLDADIVILTGDYVTHDINGRFRRKAAELVGRIESRLGVYACLGNHDYGIGGTFGTKNDSLLEGMVDGMEHRGVNVLRNRSSVLEIDGKPLWLVGLGDLWVDDFDPEKAFADVPEEHPAIVLLHNPKGARHLHSFPAGAIMSGHTHGTPLRISISGRVKLIGRPFHAGLYKVGNKKLYVNRGLGRLGRAMFNARPEITVFTLR